MGKFNGLVRNMAPAMWVWFQASLVLVATILVALGAALGGGFWILAVMVAIAFAAVIAVSSRARIAMFPPHPLMLLHLMQRAADTTSIEEFRRLVAEDWSIDQTGGASQVRVDVTTDPQAEMSLGGTTMVLPLDSARRVTVHSDAALFDPVDQQFWHQVWKAWQPAIIRALRP